MLLTDRLHMSIIQDSNNCSMLLLQGFQWQVMGVNPVAEPASAIGRYPICGNAHGGPGPLPYLTQYGEPLGES